MAPPEEPRPDEWLNIPPCIVKFANYSLKIITYNHKQTNVIKDTINNRITKLQNDLRQVTKDNFELEKKLGTTMRINHEKTIELLTTNLEAQKLLIHSQNNS